MFFSQNAFYCSPVEVDKRLCVGNWLFNQDGAVWWPWQAVNCYSVQLLPILARWNLTGCYTTICDIMLWVGGWPRWLSCSSPSQNPRLLSSLEHLQSEMLKVLFLSHTHFHTESLHGCTLSRQLLSWGRKVTYPHCQSQSPHIPDNLSLQHSYRLTAHTHTPHRPLEKHQPSADDCLLVQGDDVAQNERRFLTHATSYCTVSPLTRWSPKYLTGLCDFSELMHVCIFFLRSTAERDAINTVS